MNKELSDRTKLILGDEGIEHLKQSCVMVVGCGAVGGFALEALARAGIGHLIVVDFDDVDITNINRQIFATTKTIGKPKTKCAKERLLEINPHLKVTELPLLINEQNIDELFKEKVDFVIDAIDSLNPKTCLIEKLIENKIPFISAMGAALKTDFSKIKVASMHKTLECPLAAFLRQRLRRRKVSLKFPVVFSQECVSDKKSLAPAEEKEAGRRLMGSLVTITGMFGLLCAHEAILYITHKKEYTYFNA